MSALTVSLLSKKILNVASNTSPILSSSLLRNSDKSVNSNLEKYRCQSTSSNTNTPANNTNESSKDVKPYKFSPFDVSPSNKVDFALARIDDLLNFARRVSH
jgi:hypothetical protein